PGDARFHQLRQEGRLRLYHSAQDQPQGARAFPACPLQVDPVAAVQPGPLVNLGAVFHWEAIATARRERYYVIRARDGLILLAIVCVPVAFNLRLANASVASREELASISEGFFFAIVLTQGLAVLVVTPAVVAGALAEERQRGSLEI